MTPRLPLCALSHPKRDQSAGTIRPRSAVGGSTFAAVVLTVIVGLASGCRTTPLASAPTPPPTPRHHSLERRVMVGYQGWFRAPGDGSNMDWSHYRARRPRIFAPGKLGIDAWPDVTELDADEKFATPFRHADGSVAMVFTSHHPKTVDRHFRWMREYGLDGAFVQRFAAPIIADTALARTQLRATDNVLRYARAAAERHDRSFVVMYDLSGMPRGAMEQLKRDWRHVVDDLGVRGSPAYQHHRDRPLVAVWGVGFNDGRDYTLEECAELIAFLKDDPVYGGNTVMLGIPTWWRDQVRDAIDDPALHGVLAMADVLSPWTPGRYRDLTAVRAHARNLWAGDRAWCAERQREYLPVVFPGFSWKNLTGAANAIDRLDGRFLWEQYRQLADQGVTMVYQAMFDEMDEGTQIFKVTSSPPVGDDFITYAPLPTDHYLWLTGAAAEFIRAGRPMPERIINRPGHPETNRHLRQDDDRVYAEAREREVALATPVVAPVPP